MKTPKYRKPPVIHLLDTVLLPSIKNPGTLVFTPNKTGRYAGFMQGLSEGTHNSGIRPFMMISMISYQIGHLSHGIFHKMVGIFHDITDHLTWSYVLIIKIWSCPLIPQAFHTTNSSWHIAISKAPKSRQLPPQLSDTPETPKSEDIFAQNSGIELKFMRHDDQFWNNLRIFAQWQSPFEWDLS